MYNQSTDDDKKMREVTDEYGTNETGQSDPDLTNHSNDSDLSDSNQNPEILSVQPLKVVSFSTGIKTPKPIEVNPMTPRKKKITTSPLIKAPGRTNKPALTAITDLLHDLPVNFQTILKDDDGSDGNFRLDLLVLLTKNHEKRRR